MADDVPYDGTPLAKKLLRTLFDDFDRLVKIDRYFNGEHDEPYLPSSEDPELKAMLKKSILNMMDHAVETPAEKLYVDNVRPGRSVKAGEELPEWAHWRLSRLPARQLALYKSALKFGHSFTVTEVRRGLVQTKILSPLKTSALFADAANDETPYASLTVTEWPKGDSWGEARMWDDVNEYIVLFERFGDFEHVLVGEGVPHGASSCPVTRFALDVDTEGRTVGVIEPLINLQDRINQTIYNLMNTEAGSAYRVKTISGMAPPIKRQRVYDAETGITSMEPVFDDDGNPVVDKVRVNPAMILWAENKDTKFGTLDYTPLDGFLKSVGDAIRQFTSKSRVPPHFMLGEIANLSADALQALSEALENRVGSFRAVFGEYWSRVFRLAAELSGITEAIDDYQIEVIWRDTDSRSMSKTADGLLKLRQLGMPKKGLLQLIPGMTKTMAEEWLDWIEEEDAAAKLSERVNTASATAVARRQQVANKTGASKATADAVP